MKDLNKRDEFDDQWKGAFEDAEWNPSENVWMNINNHLVEKENSIFRRKAVFFKWTAAASLLVAISIGLISLLGQSEESSMSINDPGPGNESSTYIDESDPIPGNQDTRGQENLSLMETDKNNGDDSRIAENSSNKSNKTNTKSGHEPPVSPLSIQEGKTLLADGNDGTGNDHTNQFDGSDAPVVLNLDAQQDKFSNGTSSAGEGTAIAFSADVPEAVSPLSEFNLITEKSDEKPILYKVPEVWRQNVQKESEEKASEQLWAGVNFSSGLFDPNFQNSNISQSVNLAPALSANTFDTETFMRNNASSGKIEEESRAGVSYSAGINFGMNVSPKIVLQSGILYAVNNSSSTTNLVIDDFSSEDAIPVHVSNYSMQAMRISSRQESSPVDIANRFEFVSVPMKAGYVLFGDRLQLILSGGLSADFFMKNTLSGKSDGYQSVSMQSGSNSPFRSVFFNGLLGTELTYKIMDNYLIMIEPSYRFSVTNFAKDNYYYNSFPQSFNVGFGFKYMLR